MASLRAPDGWLTLAGLFWLRTGVNRIGTDRSNAIVLPEGSAPARVGEIDFHAGVARFVAAPGVKVRLGRTAVGTKVLQSDEQGAPDILSINSISFYVIRRGERYGVRVKDNNSPYRKKFKGLHYFPIDARYRVRARFVPYQPPRRIAVTNVLGDTEMTPVPGYVEFQLQGKTLRLVPMVEDGALFFVFRDLTTGKQTYPAGRFLTTAMPRNGTVVLDFNKAYNPPCAFTPYATCPLPPKENALPVRIEAGELRYGH